MNKDSKNYVNYDLIESLGVMLLIILSSENSKLSTYLAIAVCITLMIIFAKDRLRFNIFTICAFSFAALQISLLFNIAILNMVYSIIILILLIQFPIGYILKAARALFKK